MESYWSIESDHILSMGIGAQILVLKIDCYNKCANYWLCGCEELCVEVTLHGRL